MAQTEFDKTGFNHERSYASYEKDANDNGVNKRVQIKGSDSPLDVDDVLDGGGEQAVLTIGTSASLGAIGGTNRTNRKYVIFQAHDKNIYYGFTNTVNTSTGIKLFKDQVLMIPAGENTDIYFIADGAGKELRIQEVS